MEKGGFPNLATQNVFTPLKLTHKTLLNESIDDNKDNTYNF